MFASPAEPAYVSPTGSDLNPCTSLAPCLTWQRGYATTPPGTTLYLYGGTYAAQTIIRDASKTSTVRIWPLSTVTVGGITLGGSSQPPPAHLQIGKLPGPPIVVNGSIYSYAPSSGGRLEDTLIHNVKTRAATFHSPLGLTLRSIEIGPVCCTVDGLVLGIPRDGWPSPENITLDQLYIHDISRGDTFSHVDCIQFYGGINVTILRSQLYRCATQGIFMRQSSNGGVYRNVTISQNTVGAVVSPGGGIILSANGACDFSGYVTMRYNTSANGYRIDPEAICPGTVVTLEGNT
jgi:hypothetical protein